MEIRERMCEGLERASRADAYYPCCGQDKAYVASEKYKEGKFILEVSLGCVHDRERRGADQVWPMHSAISLTMSSEG